MERITSDCTLSEKVICKGWRFLVHSDQQVVASLRLRNDGAEASWRIHSLTEGDNVSGTVDGLRLGEGLLPDEPTVYEPRYFSMRSLRMMALWFHAEDETKDVILPISRTELEFKRFAHLAVPDFIAALGQFVERSAKINQERRP